MTAPVLDRPDTRTLVCTAGCGWDLDPAAAAGGFTTHPGCDLPNVIPQATRWRCGREHCPASGPADGDHDAIGKARTHDRDAHTGRWARPRRGRR